MPKSLSAPNWTNLPLLISSSGLLAIWALPETIALRHAFLVIGFVSSLFILKAYLPGIMYQKSAWPLWALLGFYIWLILHFALFSQDPSTQLDELRSTWARCLVSTFIGLALGLMTNAQERSALGKSQNQIKPFKAVKYDIDWTTLFLFIGFSAPCWIIFGSYLYSMLQSGQGFQFDIYSFLYRLYLIKPPYVVFEALLLPLCFILLRRSMQDPISSRWVPLILLTILLTPFGGFFIGSKNAMLIFALTLSFFLVNTLIDFIRLPRIPKAAIGAIVLVAIVGILGVHKHLERTTAWMSMVDNMRIAVDIDHHDFWKNREVFPRPINQHGELVDISTYERTAWFVAGSRLLLENPQGYGLLNHSFGILALNKWPDFYKPVGKLKGATHSGWLDLALGIGIPGVSLILICLLTAWLRSRRQTGLWYSYATWTIPLLVLTYLISEVSDDHFLELLFFMTAFFCGLTLSTQTNSPKNVQKS